MTFGWAAWTVTQVLTEVDDVLIDEPIPVRQTGTGRRCDELMKSHGAILQTGFRPWK